MQEEEGGGELALSPSVSSRKVHGRGGVPNIITPNYVLIFILSGWITEVPKLIHQASVVEMG